MTPVTEPMVSRLPDADMQAVPRALLRAAQRARNVARQTETPLVLMRDGVLVEVNPTDSALPTREIARPVTKTIERPVI